MNNSSISKNFQNNTTLYQQQVTSIENIFKKEQQQQALLQQPNREIQDILCPHCGTHQDPENLLVKHGSLWCQSCPYELKKNFDFERTVDLNPITFDRKKMTRNYFKKTDAFRIEEAKKLLRTLFDKHQKELTPQLEEQFKESCRSILSIYPRYKFASFCLYFFWQTQTVHHIEKIETPYFLNNYPFLQDVSYFKINEIQKNLDVFMPQDFCRNLRRTVISEHLLKLRDFFLQTIHQKGVELVNLPDLTVDEVLDIFQAIRLDVTQHCHKIQLASAVYIGLYDKGLTCFRIPGKKEPLSKPLFSKKRIAKVLGVSYPMLLKVLYKRYGPNLKDTVSQISSSQTSFEEEKNDPVALENHFKQLCKEPEQTMDLESLDFSKAKIDSNVPNLASLLNTLKDYCDDHNILWQVEKWLVEENIVEILDIYEEQLETIPSQWRNPIAVVKFCENYFFNIQSQTTGQQILNEKDLLPLFSIAPKLWEAFNISCNSF